MGMSAFLASLSFAWATFEYKQFKNIQYSLGIGYWGIMEGLQVVQHIYAAKPEDDYAMCSNKINQELTNLGLAHIIFQPLFVCMILMSMYRKHDITARIEADLIINLCFAGALWWLVYPWYCAFRGVPQVLIPKATPECPNYMWLNQGYDGFLGKDTPNVNNQPCTYYADTPTGHLAWSIPMYRHSYFVPSGSIHFFTFFMPYFVMFKRPFLQLAALLICLTGPVMGSYLSSSVNEQPAIWCFQSVLQATLFAVAVRYKGLHKLPVLEKIHHQGWCGEQPLTYVRAENDSATVKQSGEANPNCKVL